MSQWELSPAADGESKSAAPSTTRLDNLPPTGARQQLRAIDQCLDQLEDMHLRGAYITRQRGCQQLVNRLATALQTTPPEPVLRARNSYVLHAALLNWEGTVLDGLVPDRRQRFPDLADDEWSLPRLSKLKWQRSVRIAAEVGSASAAAAFKGVEPAPAARTQNEGGSLGRSEDRTRLGTARRLSTAALR
jgi:hypothetical protein